MAVRWRWLRGTHCRLVLSKLVQFLLSGDTTPEWSVRWHSSQAAKVGSQHQSLIDAVESGDLDLVLSHLSGGYRGTMIYVATGQGLADEVGVYFDDQRWILEVRGAKGRGGEGLAEAIRIWNEKQDIEVKYDQKKIDNLAVTPG